MSYDSDKISNASIATARLLKELVKQQQIANRLKVQELQRQGMSPAEARHFNLMIDGMECLENGDDTPPPPPRRTPLKVEPFPRKAKDEW